jgi:putative transposon-encoded protein
MGTAHIIHDKLIKPSGNTAHILIPRKYLGKRASVIIHLDDEKTGDDKNDRIRKG